MNNNPTIFSRKNITIASIILVIILVIIGTWYLIYKNKDKSIEDKKVENVPTETKKIEELQKLSESSAPVTATEKDKISELNVLQKASKPVKTSNIDQLKELEALSKSSQ